MQMHVLLKNRRQKEAAQLTFGIQLQLQISIVRRFLSPILYSETTKEQIVVEQSMSMEARERPLSLQTVSSPEIKVAIILLLPLITDAVQSFPVAHLTMKQSS
jgi:hypothetical protein